MTKPKKSPRSKTGIFILWFLMIVAIILVSYAAYTGRDQSFGSSNFDRGAKYVTQNNKYENLKGEISRFFAGVADSVWARKPDKTTLNIDLGSRPLSQILDELYRVERNPLTYEWRGAIRTRWFLADETLKTNLETYVTEENLELIWWLDKDFIVQEAFKVHSDMINTTDRIARSLQSHYQSKPQAYLCPNQRAILIAETEEARSIRQHCKAVRDIWQELKENQ